MRYSVVLIAFAVPLAGCNNSPQVHEENASVAEVQRNSTKPAEATASSGRAYGNPRSPSRK